MSCWFLLDADDGSMCVVHEKNILQAGKGINVNDKVTFFYKGVKYTGVVLNRNGNHDVVSKDLEDRSKALRRLNKKPSPKEQEASELPEKRRKISTEFYGASSKSDILTNKKRNCKNGPKMSEAEKKKQKLIEEKRAESERLSNKELLKRMSNNDDDKDADYVPIDESSNDSEDSIIKDITTHNIAKKDERKKLMYKAKGCFDNQQSCSDEENKEKSEPTAKALMDENRALKMKLQLLYDMESKKDASKKEKHNVSQTEVQEDNGMGNSNLDDMEWLNDNSKENEIESKAADNSLDGGSNAKSTDDSEIGTSPFKSADSGDGTKNKQESAGSDCEGDEYSHLTYQLYGQQADTTELGNGIFCKKTVLNVALCSSHSPSHLIRRLMHGVFIPSKIIDCSVTGQTWRAGGERASEVKNPLHQGALKAIVDFSNGVAKARKWHTKLKFEKAKGIFGVRLTELKKHFKDGKLKD